jgi:hypothetical protein
VLRVEAENATSLVSLVRMVALLKCELVEVCQNQEVTEENFRNLSDVAASGARWSVVFEREHREQFEVLTLLQTWASELCLAIVGLLWVRNHLSEGMWATALHHTKMVIELSAHQAVVSSAAESVLGRCHTQF